MEEWKSVNVEGYSEFYEVSTFGNVRSKDRDNKVIQPGKKGNQHAVKGRMLLKNTNTRGYVSVEMCAYGKRKTIVVHRLVALTFIENPHARNQVDHIDRDKSNNNVSNLRWVTGAENLANRGMPKTNTSGELHIHILYKFQVTRNGVVIQKCFKTLEEAKAFRLKELGF
jgi:hypothetical protein